MKMHGVNNIKHYNGICQTQLKPAVAQTTRTIMPVWESKRVCFFHGATVTSVPGPPQYRGFTITLFRHTTLGRTPLHEWSARRTDLYLTTHNTHKRQTSMLSAGFEPTIPVSERPQTHALDRAATGIGKSLHIYVNLLILCISFLFLWYRPCQFSFSAVLFAIPLTFQVATVSSLNLND
jgi:hypothetical protein